MFYRFRQCMGAYVFTDLLISFVSSILFKHIDWIDLLLHEAVDWLLFVGARSAFIEPPPTVREELTMYVAGVGWTFRMVFVVNT